MSQSLSQSIPWWQSLIQFISPRQSLICNRLSTSTQLSCLAFSHLINQLIKQCEQTCKVVSQKTVTWSWSTFKAVISCIIIQWDSQSVQSVIEPARQSISQWVGMKVSQLASKQGRQSFNNPVSQSVSQSKSCWQSAIKFISQILNY